LAGDAEKVLLKLGVTVAALLMVREPLQVDVPNADGVMEAELL
jgi:hypothetical protein